MVRTTPLRRRPPPCIDSLLPCVPRHLGGNHLPRCCASGHTLEHEASAVAEATNKFFDLHSTWNRPDDRRCRPERKVDLARRRDAHGEATFPSLYRHTSVEHLTFHAELLPVPQRSVGAGNAFDDTTVVGRWSWFRRTSSLQFLSLDY